MTTTSAITWGALSAIAMSTGAAAFRKGAKPTLRGYFLADSSVNTSGTVHLLLSTPFSLNGLMYQAWLGYKAGWTAVLLQVVWCISYLWLAKFANTIWERSRDASLHGVIGQRYGVMAERFAAVATILGFTMQLGWELVIGSSLFTSVTGSGKQNAFLAMLLIGIGAAAYTVLGGLRSNAFVNRLQNYYSCGFVWILFIVMCFKFVPGSFLSFWVPAWTDSKSFSLLVGELTGWGLATNLLFSLLWQFVDMSTWQTLAASYHKPGGSEPKKNLYVGAFWVLVFPGLIGTLMGMAMHQLSGITSDNIFTNLLVSFTSSPTLLLLASAALVAAMLSTVDGLILSSSQALTWDLFFRNQIKRILDVDVTESATLTPRDQALLDAQEDRILRIAQLGSFVMVILAVMGFYYLHFVRDVSIFDLVYVVVIAQMALAPTVLTVLGMSQGSVRGGAFSIAFGLLVGLICVGLGLAKLIPVFALQNAALWTLLCGALPLLPQLIQSVPGLLRPKDD